MASHELFPHIERKMTLIDSREIERERECVKERVQVKEKQKETETDYGTTVSVSLESWDDTLPSCSQK